MPTLLTLPLTAPTALIIAESQPLQPLFEELVGRPVQPGSYTLSPLWPDRRKGQPAPAFDQPTTYQWRISLLDDRLLESLQKRVADLSYLHLANTPLVIGQGQWFHQSYPDLAGQAQRRATAKTQAARWVRLDFLTPVLLCRHNRPYPLPDPALVFYHYLNGWDTFAPRDLQINVNVVDAIAAHLILIDHQLETRTVRLDTRRSRIGFLGKVTYKMMDWEKLGVDFLATVQTLARFSEFCGSGDFTEQGLGQTRFHP
jgi:CRISPR-associated endoribonuclease Cas6